MRIILVEQAAEILQVPERHVMDIIDVLEGAGVIEQCLVDGHVSYQWVAPGVDSPQERFLDTTMESMLEHRSEQHQYMTPQQLTSLLEEDSRLLMIAAHHNRVLTRTTNAFSLAIPSRNLPKCLLVEGDDCSVRPIAFSTPTTVDYSDQSLGGQGESPPTKRPNVKESVATRSSKRTKQKKKNSSVPDEHESTTPTSSAEKPHSLAVLATAFTQKVAVSIHSYC